MVSSSSNSYTRCLRRLEKEKQEMISEHKEALKLDIDNNQPTKWVITFSGAPNSLYEGEEFKLQFKFSPEYVYNII